MFTPIPGRRRTAALSPATAVVAIFLHTLAADSAQGQSSLSAAAATPDIITVTTTREATRLWDVPASIGVIDGRQLRETAPAHPQQVMSQIPGVAVAITNGEGHTTAIRQPFTTAPLYLFLEDGIPTRATGFFNHNALYEVNLPDASSMEVVRGPGSALYGSDAIGGVVNILTRGAQALTGTDWGGEANLERGSYGWQRLLAAGQWTGAMPLGEGGLRVSLNHTQTDGWRAATVYDRTSLGLRWDTVQPSGLRIKTIMNATDIDQQTGANSPLPLAEYLSNPTRNHFAIAFRKVQALRASSEFEWDRGDTLWTVTSYARANGMQLNGSFNLAADPRIEDTNVHSVGLLAKVRRDWSGPWKPRLVAGVDVDRSSGTRAEDAINVTRTGTGAATDYTAYTVGTRLYDYEAVSQSLSPYVHLELQPSPAFRVSLGLRYDRLSFDLHNRITQATTQAGTRIYAQLPQASAQFEHLSPKLGATLALSRQASLFASINDGFRTPSESQLFRAGSAANALDAANRAQLALALRPIQARQLEAGARAQWGAVSSEWVAYRLDKRDDLVSQRDLLTNLSTSVNAGHTRHQGLEWSLGAALGSQWRIDSAWSWASHRYVDWVTATADFSGKVMESAPSTVGNTRLTWRSGTRTQVQLEWSRLGPYWLEASNSPAFGRYEGHDVFHLRASTKLNERTKAFMRVMNLNDKRYADSASVSSNTPVFSPAMPRSFYLGLEVKWS